MGRSPDSRFLLGRNEAGCGRVYTSSACVIHQPDMWRMFLRYRRHVWLWTMIIRSRFRVGSPPTLSILSVLGKRAGCANCISSNQMIATSGWVMTTFVGAGGMICGDISRPCLCSTSMAWIVVGWMTTCQTDSNTYKPLICSKVRQMSIYGANVTKW